MSEWYCSCDSYSYPYRAGFRVAKKRHACKECFGPILPGERYEYATGKCEGQWFDAHTCARCCDLIAYMRAHVPCLCMEHGNAHETVMDVARDLAHEAPGLLFGAYRRMVIIERGKNGKKSGLHQHTE